MAERSSFVSIFAARHSFLTNLTLFSLIVISKSEYIRIILLKELIGMIVDYTIVNVCFILMSGEVNTRCYGNGRPQAML